MIIIKLSGGLGNQMFQYAFGRFLSEKYKMPLFFDKSFYADDQYPRPFALDIFELTQGIIADLKPSQFDYEKLKVFELTETTYHFDNSAVDVLDHENLQDTILIIVGYWQSPKYFEPINALLRKDFQFKERLPEMWEVLRRKISSVNAVMVNIRRGDYLEKLAYHGVVSREYILNGMRYYEEHVESPFFYIFSDDIPWCRSNIKANANVFFVDETYYDDKFQFYLQLMVACKYFIIANSTFSWWAAWLSAYSEKAVIYPHNWFATDTLNARDLFFPEWIRQ